jgi:hypothetical protein
MTHLESIDEGLRINLPLNIIARKIYLTYPTKALLGNEERQFQIFNQVSNFFNIPIINIHVVGSSKTGYNFHKGTLFNSLSSDLDIAIIDGNLFQHYTDWVFKTTEGLTIRTGFNRVNGTSTFEQYISCISKGFFRPDLMPTGKKRLDWIKFFGHLSSENKDLFKSINAGIYLSQTFFEFKQTSNINKYNSTKPK